jgi:hypothetical protein
MSEAGVEIVAGERRPSRGKSLKETNHLSGGLDGSGGGI